MASPPASPVLASPSKLPAVASKPPAAATGPKPSVPEPMSPSKVTYGPRATIVNFRNAQDGNRDFNGNYQPPFSYQAALNEIKAGKKNGHWIWYIIPSDIFTGSSPTSVFYGI